MNASEVYPKLWVGGQPTPTHSDLVERGVTLVIAAASPVAVAAPGGATPVEVVMAPLTDDAFQIVSGDLERAKAAAKRVALCLEQGSGALVMCREGMNRSGWVAAWAITMIGAMDGPAAIERVQSHRDGSLYNWFFCEHLRGL